MLAFLVAWFMCFLPVLAFLAVHHACISCGMGCVPVPSPCPYFLLFFYLGLKDLEVQLFPLSNDSFTIKVCPGPQKREISWPTKALESGVFWINPEPLNFLTSSPHYYYLIPHTYFRIMKENILQIKVLAPHVSALMWHPHEAVWPELEYQFYLAASWLCRLAVEVQIILQFGGKIRSEKVFVSPPPRVIHLFDDYQTKKMTKKGGGSQTPTPGPIPDLIPDPTGQTPDVTGIRSREIPPNPTHLLPPLRDLLPEEAKETKMIRSKGPKSRTKHVGPVEKQGT